MKKIIGNKRADSKAQGAQGEEQKAGSVIAVDFSQWIKEDFVRTGLQPKKGNNECRLTINDYRSEEQGNNECRIRNKEFKSFFDADSPVFDSLFLISYFLFFPMWLKPFQYCNTAIRQLKLTANNNEKSNLSAVSFAPEKSGRAVEFIQRQLKLTAKDSEKSNFSAVSFAPEKSGQAVEFIQRIKKETKNEENMRLSVQNRLAPGDKANNFTIQQFIKQDFDSFSNFITISLTNERIEEGQKYEVGRKEPVAVKPKVINSNRF